MISPGQHVSIFGLPGSGKTTLTRQVAEMYSRVIVFDRLKEWEVEGASVAHDFPTFRDAYKLVHEQASFLLIIRPRPGATQEETVALSDQVLALVYQVEDYRREGCAIVFEEIWLYVPLHGVSEWMHEILLTGRHPQISIIGNAQRPALVSKTLVSMSKHVFIGNFFENNDRKYYREMLGDHPIIENPPPKFHFLWCKPFDEPLSAAQIVTTRV